MSYTSDTEIDLEIGNNYIISSQHRRTGNSNKSIWTITFDEEVDCFIEAMNGGWKSGSEAWSLKVSNNILHVVGTNIDKSNTIKELKLAKFVDGTKNKVWHGYPADYMYKAQDRPSTEVLRVWVTLGYLTKSKMSKIRLGQSCNL